MEATERVQRMADDRRADCIGGKAWLNSHSEPPNRNNKEKTRYKAYKKQAKPSQNQLHWHGVWRTVCNALQRRCGGWLVGGHGATLV